MSRTPAVSLVCPMYNEAAGIESVVLKLKRCLDELGHSAEVLLVNDGSEDDTVQLALSAIDSDRRFRMLSHRVNFGRGRALRTGFREARGELIVTTEGDLSWGPEVIGRMVEFLGSHPKYDAVFASPHLRGGGYRNVPWHRVLLSSVGNRVLRFFYTGSLTMTTGMTRAYRASAIRSHSFTQDGKELHLEISHRLLVLGYRVGEVPAVLSWPEHDPSQPSRAKRTNWSKMLQLVGSHMAFGVLRGVSRVIAPVILLLTLAILFFGVWALWNLLTGAPSIYLAMLTGVLVILWVNLITGFFLLHHTLQVQKDVWRTQTMVQGPEGAETARPDYYFEVDTSNASRKERIA
jgi:glycosyltransferase involved in cell wall biosynthesis